MSKQQLQSNNTRLASLITELRGKAAGGGGGGGSVEMCTVTVNSEGLLGHVLYQTYENGVYTPVCYVPPNDLSTFTIETVKGQTVFFTGSDNDIDDWDVTGNAEKMYGGYGENGIGYVVAVRINGVATVHV